ncbi:MAG: alpha/beta hydrolase family protein, partial [Pyrinomonadaceae bacterium]
MTNKLSFSEVNLTMKKATVTKVFTLFLCLLGTVFSTSAQHSIEGHWEGTMIREGAQLPVSFDFINEDAGLKVSFNSPTQRALGIPIRNISFVAPKIHFELIGDTTTIVFDGDLSGGIIAGQFQENTAKGTFSLQRVTAKPPVFKQEEVSFRNRDVILSGTLLIPLTDGPHPVVVFLHGSGSEGRHASRFLAEYLTGRGIAALIYDKRGVGKSTGDWKLSDFNDLAADAMAGIDLVRGRKEINAHKIGLYGHSQGGMLAPLVASRSKDVAFVISAAGSAVPLYEAEVNSIVNQVRDQGVSGSDLADATLFIKIFVDVLRTGKGWEQFETATEKARNAK